MLSALSFASARDQRSPFWDAQRDDLKSPGRDRVATDDEVVIRVITVREKKEKSLRITTKNQRNYNRKEQPPLLLIIAITNFI